MTADELAAKLIQWTSEYNAVAETAAGMPPKLAQFLATRIAEACGLSSPGIVTARINGGMRRIRITGIGPHGTLAYEYAEGSGFGFIPKNAVLVEDIPKLTDALNQLESRGEI